MKEKRKKEIIVRKGRRPIDPLRSWQVIPGSDLEILGGGGSVDEIKAQIIAIQANITNLTTQLNGKAGVSSDNIYNGGQRYDRNGNFMVFYGEESKYLEWNDGTTRYAYLGRPSSSKKDMGFFVEEGNLTLSTSGELILNGTTINASQKRIFNLATPTSGGDATTKDYVDTSITRIEGTTNVLSTKVTENTTSITTINTTLTPLSQDLEMAKVNISNLESNKANSSDVVSLTNEQTLTGKKNFTSEYGTTFWPSKRVSTATKDIRGVSIVLPWEASPYKNCIVWDKVDEVDWIYQIGKINPGDFNFVIKLIRGNLEFNIPEGLSLIFSNLTPIKNVKNPVNPQDVATKNYVDGLVGGGGGGTVDLTNYYTKPETGELLNAKVSVDQWTTKYSQQDTSIGTIDALAKANEAKIGTNTTNITSHGTHLTTLDRSIESINAKFVKMECRWTGTALTIESGGAQIDPRVYAFMSLVDNSLVNKWIVINQQNTYKVYKIDDVGATVIEPLPANMWCAFIKF